MIGEQIVQSLNFAYIGRRLKKRNFRRIWISRISAVTKARLSNYSKFMGALRKGNVFLDRKILSYIAFYDLKTFNLIERKSREF
jgi:large subunit ribosomal protein L20